MKLYLAKFIIYIDSFIHRKFDFLNVGKMGKFNKNYQWIYKYLEEDDTDLRTKTFIEVGSRDSLDSLDILSKFNFESAYIFEASHAGIKETIKNLRLNVNLSKKISLYPFALGDTDSQVDFYEPILSLKKHNKANIGSSTIYSDKNNSNIKYKVPIFKLDSLSIDYSKNFMMIMDCEGSEYPVLKGANLALRYSKYICLESDFRSATGNCVDIKNFLESNNYKLIDCDWPNTGKGSLPNRKEVGNKQFCLFFINTKY